MAAPAPAPGPGPGPSSSSTSVSSPAGGGPRPSYRSRFGDTTLTKVFVGGLAWETPSEGLRQHFERYGDILEAVVISDRLTGRSKGYGFVTFREPEAALRAVQDPNPVIAGRRANCNIASLGPPRPRGTASIVGAHLQVPPPPTQLPAPPFYPRAPPQMVAQHGGPAMIYPPSQFGYYWYPPDFQYQQALAANPQVLQNYYAQIYGLASPAAAPPFHPYVGFLPSPGPAPAPRAVLPPPAPAMQVAGQALVHHPTPPAMQFAGQALVHHHPTPSPPQQVQHQGQFVLPTVPSLPQNFRLELPPRPAVSSVPPPSTTDLQSPPDQAATAAGATTSASSGAPGGA